MFVAMLIVETQGSGGVTGGGSGKLSVDVSLDGRSVSAKIAPEGDNRYHVSFVPIGSGVYTVRVYYSGVEVTGRYHDFVTVSLHLVHSADPQVLDEGGANR